EGVTVCKARLKGEDREAGPSRFRRALRRHVLDVGVLDVRLIEGRGTPRGSAPNISAGGCVVGFEQNLDDESGQNKCDDAENNRCSAGHGEPPVGVAPRQWRCSRARDVSGFTLRLRQSADEARLIRPTGYAPSAAGPSRRLLL